MLLIDPKYNKKWQWTNLYLPDVNIGDKVPGHFSSLIHAVDSKARCNMNGIRCKSNHIMFIKPVQFKEFAHFPNLKIPFVNYIEFITYCCVLFLSFYLPVH